MQEVVNMETVLSEPDYYQQNIADIINNISSWLEVDDDDIYTSTLHPTTDLPYQQFQVADFEANEPAAGDLLQDLLLSTPQDTPLFLHDNIYDFHENVLDYQSRTPLPQIPQPDHVNEPEPAKPLGFENELNECNGFLLYDELMVDHFNINTIENEGNTFCDTQVNNVTITTATMPACSSIDNHQVGTTPVESLRITDEIIEGHVCGDDEEENDKAESMEEEEPIKPSTSRSSKKTSKQKNNTSKHRRSRNFVSERNRRKKLHQQLMALRGLVPNITKMDKNSVLVDALAYLRSIHEETTRIEKEIEEEHHQPDLSLPTTTSSIDDNKSSSDPDCASGILGALTPNEETKSKAKITEIEIEKIEDGRFIVKITCKCGIGVGGDIFRLIESLRFDITYSSLQPKNSPRGKDDEHQQEVLTTFFIKVRKQEKMTEDKLRNCISDSALNSGLTFHYLNQ